ncbi:MAG: membrane protein insertase YidC [Verrucomicrobiales bacterium]|nr:membrane protein insertase YidC [Verrucomicrobiales bacterium]
MDRKSIIVLVVCFALLMLWGPLSSRVFPPVPVPPGSVPPPTEAGQAQTGRDPGESGTPLVRGEPTASITAPSSPAERWERPRSTEQTVELDTDEARYEFTSYGGALRQVELKDYPAEIKCRDKRGTNGVGFAILNQHAPLPALALFGGAALEDSTPFDLKRIDQGLRAEKVLTNGLRIVKEFVPSTNHQMLVSLRIENLTNTPVALPELELTLGTSVPGELKEQPRFLGVQYFNGAKPRLVNDAWFANHLMGCGCLPGTPRPEFRSEGVSNIVWASVPNRFFTLITAPETPAYQLVARKTQLDWPEADDLGRKRPVGYEASLIYPPAVIPAGGNVEHRLTLYAGPKEYNALAQLGKSQDLAMNFTSIFGWFAKALLLSMNGVHALGLSYGLTIIVITVIIKTLFWPLTQASTRSMKRMQALQPQMKEIQTKYKDDPRKMNMKLMEFMKQNRVSPLGGCLPMLLQIPVFIGFYQMLQSAVELRGAGFLWACDLSQPDTIATVFGFPINPLPLIMGATQLWQMRMTPPSPGMDPTQQKMMQYMPLMFIVILYSFPAGLALYWTVQNLLSILQMKLTKNITAGDIAAGAAGPGAPAPHLRKRGPKRR